MTIEPPAKHLDPPEWVTRALATLDAISGYTLGFLFFAGAVVLWLPSPFLGIDLSPLRASWGGWIFVGAVACLFLAISKIFRWIHAAVGGAIARKTERREREAAAARELKEREAAAARELKAKRENEAEAKRREEARRQEILSHLDTLTGEEQEAINTLVYRNERAASGALTDPTLGMLRAKGILVPAEGDYYNMLDWPHTFPDFVWEEVKRRWRERTQKKEYGNR